MSFGKGREVKLQDLEVSSFRIFRCRVFNGDALRGGEAFLILGGDTFATHQMREAQNYGQRLEFVQDEAPKHVDALIPIISPPSQVGVLILVG